MAGGAQILGGHVRRNRLSYFLFQAIARNVHQCVAIVLINVHAGQARKVVVQHSGGVDGFLRANALQALGHEARTAACRVSGDFDARHNHVLDSQRQLRLPEPTSELTYQWVVVALDDRPAVDRLFPESAQRAGENRSDAHCLQPPAQLLDQALRQRLAAVDWREHRRASA